MQIKNKMREAAKKLAVPGFDPHLSKGANHKAKILEEAAMLELECTQLGWNRITTVCIPGHTTA